MAKRRRARLPAQQESDGRRHVAYCVRALRRWRGAQRWRHTAPAASVSWAVWSPADSPCAKARSKSVLLSGTACSKRPPGVEWNALRLILQHRLLMRGIEHELVAIIGAYMAGDLEGAIENAHTDIGGDQGQLASNRFRRDGVIVEIEAHIDGLARAHGLDPVGGERMQRRRQQAGLFFTKSLGDSAVVAARPAPLMRDLISPE